MSGFSEIPEQPDDVPGRPIAWTLLATVLAIVTCGCIVWALKVFDLGGGGESRVEQLELAPPAQPFSEGLHTEHVLRRSREQLDDWSWADRATRRVRVPVDVAIDRYLEQRGLR